MPPPAGGGQVRDRRVVSTLLNTLAWTALGVIVSAAPAAARSDAARDAELQPERVMDALGIRPAHRATSRSQGRRRWQVYANDIDGGALEHVASAAATRESATSRCADVGPDLPRAHIVIMVYAIHDFAEPQAFLQKLKESLKPGATVVILDRDPEATGERHFLPRERLLALFGESGYVLSSEERFVEKHLLLVFRVA